MNREQYLSDPQVAGFVGWLSAVIVSENAFTQSFYPRNGHGQFEVCLTSFRNAVDSYDFGGQDLTETQVELDEIAKGMQVAMREYTEAPDSADQHALLIACLKTLVWGGVTVKSTIDWLAAKADEGALHNSIRKGCCALLSDSSESLDVFRDTRFLRSDSAATKIYAMADSRSIIYDNRVGAALAKLVCEYLDQMDIEDLPDKLSFMVLRDDVRRNPSVKPHREFDFKVTGYPHARWNQRANWIVNSLVGNDAVASVMGQFQRVSAVRAIEAALFVMGDDVRNLTVSTDISTRLNEKPQVDYYLQLSEEEVRSRYSILPEVIAGRPVNHKCVPSVHDFESVIHCFYGFRQSNPGSDDRDAIIRFLQRDMNVGSGSATAYFGPLGSRQLDLIHSPDDLVGHLAENPLSAESYAWLEQMWNGPRLQSNLVSTWAVGRLVSHGLTHRDDQTAELVYRGLAGRNGSAQAIIQVGRKFGIYFGLLDSDLAPTDIYHRLFTDDEL